MLSSPLSHLAVAQAEHDVLRVIAEQPAKQVDPANMGRRRLHADPDRDQRVLVQVEVVERHVRDLHPLDEAARVRHLPDFQQPVLRIAVFPP